MKAILVACCFATASAMMPYASPQLIDSGFERKVALAVEDVKNLFAPSRHIASAMNVPHYYEDKYYLAEFLATMGISSTVVGLDRLGITLGQLAKLKAAYDAGTPTQFVYKSRSTTSFVRKEAVEDGKVTETLYTIFGAFKRTSMTTITRYHWNVDTSTNISAVNPLDPSSNTVLKAATSRLSLFRNSNEQAPTLPDGDATLDGSALFASLPLVLDPTAFASSSICRAGSTSGCTKLAPIVTRRVTIAMNSSVTPTSNKEINGVRSNLAKLADFAGKIASHVRDIARTTSQILPAAPTYTPAVLLMDSTPCGTDASELDAATRPANGASSVCTQSVVVGAADAAVLLQRYEALYTTYEADLAKSASDYVALVTGSAPPQSMGYLGSRTAGATLSGDAMLDVYAAGLSLELAVSGMSNGLDRVRDMLYQQVMDAVGQRVTAEDVMTYATGVGAAALVEGHRPSGFSFAIRRAEDAPSTAVVSEGAAVVTAANPPEGFLSVEWLDSKAVSRPLKTVVQPISKAEWNIEISDGVSAVINSTSFAHGFVIPAFGGSGGTIPSFSLNMNARPFGGLILVVGSVIGSTISPDAAVIVRDRDAVKLPLLLNAIPSPKDFAKAISSISPRMRAFAEAFRSLQLQKSVLAVAAIPLKPQMETILRLPPGALSKHLALTDSLLRLFLDYGISPSLLAYDSTVDAAAVGGGANASDSENAAAAIAAVKKNVANVLAAIDAINQRALTEKAQETLYNGGGVGGGGGGGAYMPGSGGVPPYAYAPVGPSFVFKGATAGGFGANIGASIDSFGGNGGRLETAASGQSPAPTPPSPPPSPKPDGMQPQPPQPATYAPGHAIEASTVTTLPKALDARFLVGDVANALRPTILSIGDGWTRTRALSFLERPSTQGVSSDQQNTEKRSALQLLDILTEAGGAPIDSASLHFILGATHNFAQSVMSSVVDGNINVLLEVTRSILMVSEVLSGMTGAALVDGAHPDSAALLAQ